MKLSAEHVRLYLLPEVEERIRHYSRLADGEISGLGAVEEFDGGFLVTDLYLPKQTCSPASTVLDQDAVATLLLELDRAGKDPGTIRFWWHSHGDLGAFWSRTDAECVENLTNGDYLLSMVTNRRGDVLARIDVFRPVRFTVDGIGVSVRSRTEGLFEACRREVEEKVAEWPGPPLSARPAEGGGFLDGPGAFLPDSEADLFEERFVTGDPTWEDYAARMRETEGERGGET